MANFVLLTHTLGDVWQRSIGPYQIAHHCRQNGFTSQVIDFTELFKESELEEAVFKFVNEDTLAVGLSTTFYRDTIENKYIDTNTKYLLENKPITVQIEKIIKKIKNKFPNLKIIAGGASSYLVQDDPLFDAVIHGYGEVAVVNYLKNIKEKKKVLHPKLNNVDNINGAIDHFDIETLNHFWAKEDCVLDNETLPIEISRGCIFKCSFCSYPLNGKKKFDYLRDPELIRDELIFNYENYGTTNYFFSDDTFNDSTIKVEQLHKIFTSLPFKIKFVTYLRIDLLHAHREQIDMLYEMGLGTAFFGIETFDHNAAKSIGKGMHPDKVKDMLLELYYDKWKTDVSFTCSLIVGLPGETKESVYQSFEWMKDKPFNDTWLPLRLGVGTYWKSEFETNYEKYGYKLDSTGNWSNDTMTYDDARAIAQEFNDQHFYKKKPPASWFEFSLLTHGYKLGEFKNTSVIDLPWKSFMLQKHRLFREYKKKLMLL